MTDTAERLDRRAVVGRLLAHRGDALVVTGLGAPTYDVAAAGDSPRNFYLWGAMGGAAMVGVGLALARPALPVLVVTGDGEMLMGLGALATIAAQATKNLTVVVLDNGLYGETGGQPSHTALGADLAAIARASGIADARKIEKMAEVESLARRLTTPEPGPTFAAIAIDQKDHPRILPTRDGFFLRARVRQSLGLEPM